MITGYGGKDVPPYNRFYLGGEQDVRGYDFYTISPFVVIPFSTTTNISFLNPKLLNQQGVPTLQTLPVNVLEYIPTRPGGDLQGVLNLEYRIPIVSRVTFDLFNDLAHQRRVAAIAAGTGSRGGGFAAAAISESGFSEFEDFEQPADSGGHQFPAAHFGGSRVRGVSADRECAVPLLLRVQLPAA